MPLINEQISNLINGVSQQPPSLRLASQSQAQENGLSTIAEGLKKRPPLEHVAKLTTKTDLTANVHFVNRSLTDRSLFYINSSGATTAVSAFDLSGAAQSVSGVSGANLTYITTTNARDNLQLFSVADSTFILNREKVAAKSGTISAARNPEGLFFLKQATNTTSFEAYIDGVLVSTVAGNNNAATQTTDLFNDLVASVGSGGSNTFDIVKFGSSNVHVTRKNGADFTMHANAPSVNFIAIKDSVVKFTELPARTKDGFIIRISGSPNSGTDDYFIKHNNSSDQDVGEWVEVVGPGLANAIDPATMPLQVASSSGSHTVSDITWVDRAAGDLETSPDPSFIGKTINDMFYHKNRLGFLADENVVLSELGEHFNFYTTTATDLLDTDVIDLATPTNDINILKHAIPFNENLMVFSDRGQFRLSEASAGGLTPTNATLSLLTEYTNDTNVKPIVNGRKIYFTSNTDGFLNLREFGVIEDLQEETAEDITSHIPSYIKGNGVRIISYDDFLFVLSDENLNEVFVYKFLFQQGVKKLSSWSKWKFKDEEKVIGMEVINHIAYFVVVRGDGTYLDKMSIQDANLVGLTASASQLPFKVLLDRLVTLTGVYNAVTDVTTWTLPYPDDNGSTFRAIYGPAWVGQEGGLVQGLTQPTSTTLTAGGDHSSGSCFVGKEYLFLYEFTAPTIKTEVAGRLSSLSGGVYKIRKFNVDYFKTGFFNMVVTIPGRSEFTHVFTGRILGSALNNIGDIPFETGSFKKLIFADAKNLKVELKSNSYLPCAFTGADWEGQYTVRTVPRTR